MSAPHMVQTDAVPINQLRSVLNDTWAQVSAGVQAETGDTPLRTATLTLAIITTTPQERERARATIQQLATATPARVLLFGFVEPDQEIMARVSAHCTFARRKHHGTCYDIIDIDVPREQYEAIPNIIASQRISQLPAFIIWTGDVDITSAEFLRVSRPADRLIIDSEQFSDRLTALRNWGDFLAARRASFAGGDLAWTRIATWRELIAQSFDNPITAGLVPNISRVSITFDAGAESSALLLASWLTSRIACQPLEIQRAPMSTTLRARDLASNRTIEINLDHSQSVGFGVRAVRLQTRAGDRVTRMRIRRDEKDHSSVRIQTTGMPAWERVVPHVNQPRHELISVELMCFDRDRIYDEALAHAAAFARMFLDSEQ